MNLTEEKLKPINKKRLHQEVVQQFKELMVNGYYKPGSKLPPSRELAKKFSVSRAVISEAMTILEVMGLVQIKPGRGTYVTDLLNNNHIESEILSYIIGSKGDIIQELTELRLVLEPEIAKLAAERRDDKDIKEIENVLKKMETKFQNDELFIDESMDFHLVVAKATKNQIIMRVLIYLNIMLRDSRVSLLQEGRAEMAFNLHRKIFNAIISQNGDEAKRLMKYHLEELLKYYIQTQKNET